MLKKFMAIVYCSIFILFFAGCSRAECIPGNYDGPWENSGSNSPPVDQIENSMIGRSVSSANQFLSASILSKDLIEDGITYRAWMFESHKELVKKDCVSPDKTVYRQEVMVIKARYVDGIIKSCTIDFRGSLSDKSRGVREIISDPASPLDGNQLTCSQKKTGTRTTQTPGHPPDRYRLIAD